MSHTPGPWALDGPDIATHDGKTLLGYYVNQPTSGGRIAKTFANCLVTDDSAVLDNARLIAAAPEMLKALKHAEKLAWEVGCETEDGVGTILSDSRGDLWREIVAAIAKAEGK